VTAKSPGGHHGPTNQAPIVVDMVSCVMVDHLPQAVDDHLAGGVNAVGATIVAPAGSWSQMERPEHGLEGIGLVQAMAARRPDRLLIVETTADLERARRLGRLGLILHFQNSTQLGIQTALVDGFAAAGLRVVQLAYNIRNWAADGCVEETDAGLSRFGRKLVKALSAAHIAVDGSHTGRRSTLDAMELVEAPFIFSHSGCKSVFDHPRNLDDDQLAACAATGGVVGIVGLPSFITSDRPARIDHLIDHIAYAADRIGPEHVGIGLDFFEGSSAYPIGDELLQMLSVEADDDLFWPPGSVEEGLEPAVEGLESPRETRNLATALLRRGVSESEVHGIMGMNFCRALGKAWGEPARGSEAT
jgi:membrane dipeptidase